MLVVGISGVARSGKNLFCDMVLDKLAKRGVSGKQFALADALKADCEEFLNENCGLNVWTSVTEDKSLFRDFLVWYGDLKRKQTNGRYWVEKMNEQFKTESVQVALVSDVRYDTYSHDELSWVEFEHEGLMVHLRRWLTPDISMINLHSMEDRIYIEAPNEHERINDPKLRKGAHLRIDWPTVDDPWESNETNEVVLGVVNEIEELVYK
jgi:hypothetical protein